MAKDWGATKKWRNSEYLIEEAGTSTSLVSIMTQKVPESAKPGDKLEWSLIKKRSHKQPLTLEKALKLIANNTESSIVPHVADGFVLQSSDWPRIHYLDDDLLRAPRLRSDYSFPYLHKFLRLQRTTLTIWPEMQHRPRQV
jgi:hypothetical protein